MTEPLTLDRYFATPRLSGLRLSPDGSRLVVAVSRPGPEPNELRTAIWQVDPAGATAPRRLTRSSAGESAADIRARRLAAVHLGPAGSGRQGGPGPARSRPSGRCRRTAARRACCSRPTAGSTAWPPPATPTRSPSASRCIPLATSLEDDAARAKARKDAGVGALLFEDYPIRYWDHWLAPQRQRIFAARCRPIRRPGSKPSDLTGDPGPAFLEPEFDISPDGKNGRDELVRLVEPAGDPAATWSRIDVEIEGAPQARRPATRYYDHPRFSPDGRFVAAVRDDVRHARPGGRERRSG